MSEVLGKAKPAQATSAECCLTLSRSVKIKPNNFVTDNSLVYCFIRRGEKSKHRADVEKKTTFKPCHKLPFFFQMIEPRLLNKVQLTMDPTRPGHKEIFNRPIAAN